MIVGIGVDAVAVPRMRRALERTPRLRDRVFTSRERASAEGRGDPYASLAARFAAKEASRKALGRPLPWKDVEVVSGPDRAPALRISGHEDLRLHVSLTHTADLAIAVVVAETR